MSAGEGEKKVVLKGKMDCLAGSLLTVVSNGRGRKKEMANIFHYQ